MLNHRAVQRRQVRLKRQAGMSLMEVLIAAAIGLIAVAGMLVLMANTFSTGSKTIRVTGLTKEMRTAMQIMTRELRRANYHGTYAACFGDDNCIAALGISGVVKNITINGGSGGSCFWFWYDRPQGSSTPVAIGSEQVAAFRRATDGAGVGTIEMTVGGTAAPNCNDDSANWQTITDPDIYDITAFTVTSTGSFASTVTAAGATLSVNRIGIAMTGSLVNDPSIPAWMGGSHTPTVQLEDFVRVRNDVPSPPGP
jgi:type IV pilus assembly protein PilW